MRVSLNHVALSATDPLADLRPQEGERARATLFQTGIPFRCGAGQA